MESLTAGIILDFSGSMAENASEVLQEGGKWVNSVFEVMDNLIEHLFSEHEVFAVGVGAMFKSGLFDVLRTMELFKCISGRINVWYDDILDGIYSILERNGARQIRKWAERDIVKSVVSYEIALAVLIYLESERGFTMEAVRHCLPAVCRDWAKPEDHGFLLLAGAQWAFTSVVTTFIQATETEIQEVRDKLCSLMMKDIAREEASAIIHGCMIGDYKRLDSRRITELKEIVRPFINGDTPLFEALRKVIPLFRNAKYNKKLLFILSDRKQNDQGDSATIKRELNEAGVTVVCCYIARSRTIDSRHLFSKYDQRWEDDAQFFFNLSSTITTQSLPRTVFIKQGWKVDIENNETRLFLQINHPDHINDVCNLVRNIVCVQDALSDILASVSLDMYHKQLMTGFTAQKQVGCSSYANASAVVLHLSLKRILGRHGGYPDYYTLRQEIIDLYGSHGAAMYDVLKRICPKYRLHCGEIDVARAMKAITENRPVVAIFHLTDPEWNIFTEFYNKNPTGILNKNELDIRKRRGSEKLSGHAVVLTSFNSECLYLMNSWGDDWGDMGFFRVQSADVLDFNFIDVYWTEDDLFDSEKLYYQKHGAQVAADLISKLQGLQKARYTCPLCETESFVTEFTGTLSSARCPSCEGNFESGESGNILAMNIHLLSLTR